MILMKKPEGAQLHVCRGYVLFEGVIPHTHNHRHHALEIFIGVDDPMDIISGVQTYSGRVLVVDANTLHRVSGPLDRKIVLMLDSESAVARSLRERFLIDRSIADLSTAIDTVALIKVLTETEISSESPSYMYNCILAYLINGKQFASLPDERIRKVQDYLRGLKTKKASLSAIAKEVYLSESRLVHLFKEQVGIPIRRYQLWLRLIDAVGYILDGRPLTESAHLAGFSDYAHLSRTFTHMFGYSLSDIFKNRASIEIVSNSEL
jgi:AraC-like DNA-binding protein